MFCEGIIIVSQIIIVYGLTAPDAGESSFSTEIKRYGMPKSRSLNSSLLWMTETNALVKST